MTRQILNVLTTGLAPFILIFIVASLYIAEIRNQAQFYQFAWYALVLVVLIMEARVRLGYRTKRGGLFYFHIMCAIPFFVSLTALAFFTHPFWLAIFCDIVLIFLGVPGITLFYKTIAAHNNNLTGLNNKNTEH